MIVNRVRPPRLPARSVSRAANGKVDASRVRAGLATAGLDLDEDTLDGLVAETVEHAVRVQVESDARADLAEADLPALELPEITDGIDVAALYELAEALLDQGTR